MNRSGFTLVELLVVIGIMGLLTLLLVAAIGPLLGNAKEGATKVTIAQLNDMVKSRVSDSQRSVTDSRVRAFKTNYDTLHSPSISEAAAKSILESHAYRSMLPQRVEDLWGLDGATDSPPGSVDDSVLVKGMWESISGTPPWQWKADSWIVKGGYANQNQRTVGAAKKNHRDTTAQQLAESSELLYVSLSQKAGGVDSINPLHVKDTDGDGNMEFVDAWEVPLQFYNFPTRLFKPSGSIDLTTASKLAPAVNATIAGADPLDPTGMIANFSGIQSDFTLGTSSYTVLGYNESNYRTMGVYWVPLILSFGPDTDSSQIGLPASTSTTRLAQPVTVGADAFNDDITNLQR